MIYAAVAYSSCGAIIDCFGDSLLGAVSLHGNNTQLFSLAHISLCRQIFWAVALL